METLKHTLFSNWNFIRSLRLVMGLIIAYQAFEVSNVLLGVLGGWFIFQALANVACCGGGTCSTTPRERKPFSTEDVEFEEIKANK